LSAMLDRVDHPARGRQGGSEGGATVIARDDGTVLRGKGRQFVPDGVRVRMAFPGGGGYGPPGDRDPGAVLRDVVLGYVTPEAARSDYGLSEDDVQAALVKAEEGELP
ncbi:MAG: hydantoinase B/oxoprolinase family protein, partial [Pseudomonadota bacterium]